MNTPFTAEEIRDNCPPGRTVVTRTSTPGTEPTLTTSRFVECDDHGARTTWVTHGLDGTVLGEGSGHATWEELRRHAAFPEDRTTVAEATISTTLGECRCRHYRVVTDDTIKEFWFDTARPGMPILVVETRPDGSEVRTEVVEDRVD
jgi:hypothetical protein